MKFKAIFAAAGLAVAALGITGTAQARDRWDEHRGSHHDRWDRHDRHDRWDRHDRRDWRDYRRSDRGRHYGWRDRGHCWTDWRRGERVRICRR